MIDIGNDLLKLDMYHNDIKPLNIMVDLNNEN